MKRRLLRVLLLLVTGYLVICTAMYFFQEALLFHPNKLGEGHVFAFSGPFEEKWIQTSEGLRWHGLFFPADSSKGVILYLHGNGGTLNSWGKVAPAYTSLGYDVFMIDYPGFGKSEGSIESEEQLIAGAQAAYDTLRKSYAESEINLLGYSMGTGIAARLASTAHPGMLILQAPYLSMKDLAHRKFPWVPSFILRYPLLTNEHLKSCTMPVVIFHGDRDGSIPYDSSLELMKEAKLGDTLITLHGWGHNGFTNSPEYLEAIQQVLR